MQSDKNKDYSGLEELINLEVMKNYNHFVVSSAIKHSGKNIRVIDYGAGIGTLSLIFHDCFGIKPLCVEIDPINKKYLRERRLDCFDSLEKINDEVDLIFSSNVLEHIEDDMSALHSMKNSLQINGKIYLYLPAKKILWSEMDRVVGHYRRYEPSEIKTKCEKIGFKVESLYYADSIGFFASLILKLIGYNTKSGIGSKKSLIFYDKYIFPISKVFDFIGLRFLFGKNIILVAKKIN